MDCGNRIEDARVDRVNECTTVTQPGGTPPPGAPATSAAPSPGKKRKPKAKSPTARSLEYLRKLGYIADVTERWIPKLNVRKDLFGFIDIVAINDTEVLAVQATSGDGGNVSARVTKIAEHDNYPMVCKHMRIVVHGWRKNAAGRWTLREVEL